MTHCIVDIKKEFEKYLMNQGFKRYDSRGGSANVSAYLQNLDTICQKEKIDWDTLERNIVQIKKQYSRYSKDNQVMRNALNAFSMFVSDKNKVENNSWDDFEPAILSIGVLDPDILEDSLNAADPENREIIVNNLKDMGFLQG